MAPRFPKPQGTSLLNQLQPKDLEELRTLLALNSLDASDLKSGDMAHFVGTTYQGALIAVGGLEIYNKTALLRSVATSPEYRGRGLAQAIVGELEKLADSCGVSSLYLLTETASNFFEKLGYQQVERSTAPDDITATRQFSDLCPSSAELMMKNISN